MKGNVSRRTTNDDRKEYDVGRELYYDRLIKEKEMENEKNRSDLEVCLYLYNIIHPLSIYILLVSL